MSTRHNETSEDDKKDEARPEIASIIALAQHGKAEIEFVDSTIRSRYRVAPIGEDYPVIMINISSKESPIDDFGYFTDGRNDIDLLPIETTLLGEAIARNEAAAAAAVKRLSRLLRRSS